MEKFLLLIATNTNLFTLLFNELKTDGKSFIFAVCRLTYDLVTSNLISLMSRDVNVWWVAQMTWHKLIQWRLKSLGEPLHDGNGWVKPSRFQVPLQIFIFNRQGTPVFYLCFTRVILLFSISVAIFVETMAKTAGAYTSYPPGSKP